ncbi:hypothetical protein AsAng_0020930 [Aureispira anguillae]|uniref:Uncharacterized protein n=1 Tax=Aureispira anguillae TaxID=2864201 RepID=A0A916DQU2_9BACT|nr:hypothetical protein AsAng_0020930 [Aureispira anguillae]
MKWDYGNLNGFPSYSLGLHAHFQQNIQFNKKIKIRSFLLHCNNAVARR